MDENVEFINMIYKNTMMGIYSIKDLLRIVLDDNIIRVLREQLKDYEIVEKECTGLIKEYDGKLIEISKMTRCKSSLMIKLNTAFDKSKQHIAEMMEKGSIMGINDVKSKLEEYKKAHIKVKKLAEKLLEIEENNLKKLEKI